LDESDRRRRRRCEADAKVLDGWAATVLDGLRWKSAAAIDTMCGESEGQQDLCKMETLIITVIQTIFFNFL
jgi:hypothetical protein